MSNFEFDYNRLNTDEDDLITSEILVRYHTALLTSILDHPTCSQEIKDMVESKLAIINPIYQDYVGIKEIIPPKQDENGNWHMGQTVFKNGVRYPYIGKGTVGAFPDLYKEVY